MAKRLKTTIKKDAIMEEINMLINHMKNDDAEQKNDRAKMLCMAYSRLMYMNDLISFSCWTQLDYKIVDAYNRVQ